MEVLLEILIEAAVLIIFLYIGKSIMKAQLPFQAIAITALAGAFANQVPFIGTYVSVLVILFFLWKMARVDMVPDGVLILIIGKGCGVIAMIYVVGIFMEEGSAENFDSFSGGIPIYVDDDGIKYFAEGEQMYYFDENEEQVFVSSDKILGISEIMEMEASATPESTEVVALEEGIPEEIVDSASLLFVEEDEQDLSHSGRFTNPIVSDSVIRGATLPFEIFVPKGWKISREAGKLAIRYGDHTYFNYYASFQGSDNQSYLRSEVSRVMSQYPGYGIAKQDIVQLDSRPWARIQLANDGGDQVLLLTHGDIQGCYSVELNGSFEQLSSQKSILNRMMFSFNFPPSTYFLTQVVEEE